MDEIWRKIDAYPGYEVSNVGNVRDVLKDRILKASVNYRGHIRVNLKKPGDIPRPVPIGRLVALAFVDGYFEDAVVAFKDGNKLNVHADNLFWKQVNFGIRASRDVVAVGRYNRETDEIEWEGRGQEVFERVVKKKGIT